MRKNVYMVTIVILFIAIYNFILMQLLDLSGLVTPPYGGSIVIYSLAANVLLSISSAKKVIKIFNINDGY